MRQIAILNYLRGLAALLVLFNHAIENSAGRNISSVKEIGQKINLLPQNFLFLKEFSISCGQIGVAVFFLISGFLIMKSRQNHSVSSYVKSRSFRIFPICIISVLLCHFVIIFANNYFLNSNYSLFSKNDLIQIFLNAFLLVDLSNFELIEPVYWTLLIEIKFYIFMIFAKNFKQKEFVISSFCMLTFVTLSVFLSLNFLERGSFLFNFFLAYAKFASYVIFMFLGCFLFLIYDLKAQKFLFTKENLIQNLLSLLIIFCTFCISLEIFKTLEPSVRINFANYFLTLIIFGFILVNLKKISGFSSKILNFFGNISYPLYTTHYTFFSVGIFAFSSVFVQKTAIFYSISIAFCILLAFILHILIEKPFLKLKK